MEQNKFRINAGKDSMEFEISKTDTIRDVEKIIRCNIKEREKHLKADLKAAKLNLAFSMFYKPTLIDRIKKLFKNLFKGGE